MVRYEVPYGKLTMSILLYETQPRIFSIPCKSHFIISTIVGPISRNESHLFTFPLPSGNKRNKDLLLSSYRVFLCFYVRITLN